MRAARTVAGAAAGIAVVTAAARVAGFGRVVVLTRTLGTGCVGDAYQSANQLPNVVFEVVAGGALASLVVPLVAGAVASGDREQVSRTASALLTWTVLVLTPVTLLGLLVAPALLRAAAGAAPACGPDLLATGTRMLRVFLPQVVLYGVGIVVAGVLQAHRRFLGPALAPLLSSFVVMASYLAYAAQGRVELADLGTARELTLSVGTTLGVAVLSLSLLVPLRRCGLVLRPTLRFPAGVATRARSLAGAGVAGLAAQQVALLVALRLANSGARGDVVVFFVVTAVFVLPAAVLAVPLATSAFPVLAAHHAGGDERAYAEVVGSALRGVLVLMLGATAVLAVVARPAAAVLGMGAPGADRVDALRDATLAFAPGLLGFGLLALVGRALYARGDGRTPAAATVIGWLAVALVDVVAAQLDVPRVVALGIGNSVGLSLAGVLLVVGLRRVTALPGAGRTMLAGLGAAAVVSAVGLALPVPAAGSVPGALLEAVLLAAIAGAGYVGVVRLLDPSGLRVLRVGGS